jgi:hypothetical protein
MRLRRFIVWASLLIWGGGAAADFEFVVIGDTRPRFERENFAVFEGLVQKMNREQPAFIVNLGDLIYGYGVLRKEKQWDKYQAVVRAIRPPYYQVPGNHDTFSKAARKIYVRRFGKTYGSFDHGDCHFVLLDNCEGGRWGYLGSAQLDWLRADLAATPARAVFVFLHFPVWEAERVAPPYHRFWSETLHPLFRASRVKGVFGGHAHCYGPTREFDGIRYFVTGGGGAELLPDYRKSGGVHHFVKVMVSGDSFDLRVITDRGELTDVEADIMGGLLFADRHSSRIGIAQDAQGLLAGATFSLSVTNPYAETLSGTAEWSADPQAFSVEPRAVAVGIPPRGAQRFSFTLKARKDSAPLETLPWLEFSVRAGAARHRFHREVIFLRELKAPYCVQPPDLDGRLKEWPEIPLLRLGGEGTPTATVQAAHDRQMLYLAVSVPKPRQKEETEDSLFHDDLQVGIARRLNASDFAGDSIRLGLAGAGGSVVIQDRTPGHPPGGAVRGTRGGCRDQGDRTAFEIAIPFAGLRFGGADGAGRLVLSLAFPLPEDSTDAGEPADPKPGSFSYQVRYGGDALVPIHFVELQLERSPSAVGPPSR